MRNLLSTVCLFLLLASASAQTTPTSILQAATAYQSQSDRNLQVISAYCLAISALGAVGPTAALQAAAAYQGLDDRSLQIIQTYCLAQLGTGSFPTGAVAALTVSAKGITNGLSTVANDGARFGPDTVGTQTSGIQEALNAIPIKSGWGTNTSGAVIQFNPGDYYCTNSLFFSNTYIYSILLRGASILGSRLIYAGSIQTNLLRFCGGGNPNGGLNLPGQVQLENLTFTSITNDLLALVVITNSSYARVRDCNFTGWEITTNQTHGAQLSIDGPYPTQPPGNVGLVVGSALDHGTFIEDCFFANLACAIDDCSDHAYITGIKTAFLGVYIGGGAGADGTAWPNTSPYFLGPTILIRGGLGAYVNNAHFYICNGGILNEGTQDVVLRDPQWEICDHALAAFNPAASGTFYVEEAAISDDLTKYAINHGPYSYSSSTAVKVVYNHTSKLLANTGLDGNNNNGTNFNMLNAITMTATNGYWMPSNAISTWPATPRLAGDCFWGNSNGVIYQLVSKAGSLTWSKTNLIGVAP